MEQSPAWASDILALYHEMSRTISSRKLINENKCAVFKFLVDCTSQYVQLWWIGRFGKEVNTKAAAAVGEQLVSILKRGQRLLQQCVKEKGYAKSVLIILGNAGEFCEIVDDVKRYCQMMNKIIARIVGIDSTYCGVHNPDKEQLIKQLHDKVELDCSMLHNALTSAHIQDRNALMEDLKDARNSSTSWWGRNNSLSRFYNLSGLIGLLKGGMHPIACSIANSNLLTEARPLGVGTYGVVRKAQWHEIPVATKEFFHDSSFAYEYNIFMKLMSTDCSHIVQIFGHSELKDNGSGIRKTLVMELMKMDLKKLIEQNIENNKETPPFSLLESTDLILQIAKGMRDLHRADVIHRDIKTSNILVKKNPEDGSLTLKIADFGESQADFHTKANIHTTMRGTASYMAPEMVAGEGHYSRMVDVYSFGLVCTEILTGKHPDSVMLDDLKKGRIPFFTRGLIFEGLYRIISDCLELAEEKRPSFEEICERLWALKEKIFFRELDEIQSYIDEKSQLETYIKVLGKKGRLHISTRTSAPSGKRAIDYCPQTLVEITLFGLGVESSGHIKLLQPGGNLFIGRSGQQDLPIFEEFGKLVNQHKQLINLSFAIGGWPNPMNFSNAFSTSDTRANFVNSVLEWCRAYRFFTGLVIEWPWLCYDGQFSLAGMVRKEDGGNFILVLEQLRRSLPKGFVISVGSSRLQEEVNWPIETAIHLIDRIKVYNCFIPGGKTAHHTANLYSSFDQRLCLDEAIRYFIARGIPSTKIFLQCSHYAFGFSDTDDIGKPASRGLPHDLEGICPSQLVDHGFVEKWDDEAKAPYAHHPARRLICVYDNVRSSIAKAEYIKAMNLGGIFMIHCQGQGCSIFKVLNRHLIA